MWPRCLLVSLFSMSAVVLGASVVFGQNYPSKPIRIVTSVPGAGNDLGARLIAQGLTTGLGNSVIVENRGGGGGLIAIDTVAKAQADGYTLLFYGSSTWILPLMQKMSYDPIKDLAPITMASRAPYVVVVYPAVPANSVKELIALAKSKPGELSYASGGTGSATHLAGALFMSMARINIVHVQYKGPGPAYNDLISGQVHTMFTTAGGAFPQVKSGRLRALAVASIEPSVIFPGVPTVTASGLPGYEFGATYALFAPTGTPPTIIKRLNQEAVRFLRTPEAKERFLTSGLEAIGSSPEQLAAAMTTEMNRIGKVIREARIRVE